MGAQGSSEGAGLPPAILIGGSANALSAARSLARRGVAVHALGHSASPVRHSRAVVGFTDIGMAPLIIDRSLDWLARRLLGDAVVLPCSDDALHLLVAHGAALQDWGYVIPEMDVELASQLLDKERTYELAREIDIAAPETLVPGEGFDAVAAMNRLGSPCAIKPRHSQSIVAAHLSLDKAIVVNTPEELTAELERVRQFVGPPIVTEIVPGPDTLLSSYWAYVDSEGRTLLELTKRKVRQLPVGFGTGCNAVTTWDEDLANVGRQFVRGIGLVGFAATEFKRRPDTSEPVVIESNYRLVDANEHARAVGIDVAWVQYRRALGKPVAPEPPQRDGVHFWYPLRDLRSCRSLSREEGGSFASWAGCFFRPHRTPYFAASDPVPSAMVAVQSTRNVLSSIARATPLLRRSK